MKTKTINLYKYSELKPTSYQKAYKNWYEQETDPFMQSHMINLLGEELEERGIKYSDLDVRYSLSYCQGDGFMFVGVFEWKGYTIVVEHNDPHYYHMYTAQFTWPDFVGEDKEQEEEKIANKFKEVYQEICKEMERIGYDHIDYITSEESFQEACEANGYTFREDGTMENA